MKPLALASLALFALGAPLFAEAPAHTLPGTDATTTIAVATEAPASATVRVLPTIESRLPRHLFGHFMERATWGEPGFLAATRPDNPRQLRDDVIALIREMNVSLIRFPVGTNLDSLDWRDLVENVPGRDGPRPSLKVGDTAFPQEFGYHEFLVFCQQQGIEPLLSLGLRPALEKDLPLAEAARLWAGLVAYCNLPVGAKLPDGMPDWPALRARNGHPEPFRVRYIQIGNEQWVYFDKSMKKLGLDTAPPEQRVAWYLECVKAYVDAVRALDPSVTIIADAPISNQADVTAAQFANPAFRPLADLAAIHVYRGWGVKQFKDRDLQPVPFDRVTAEEIWNTLVSAPEIDPATGVSVLKPLLHEPWDLASAAQLPVAITEWNISQWWKTPKDQPQPAIDSNWARAVGSAGILHAFFRGSDRIALAAQSMLVGSAWDINAIRVPKDGGPAHLTPYGHVFALYANHHGDRRLAVEATGAPRFERPYTMRDFAETGPVSTLDAVATRNDTTLYIHLIHRGFSRAMHVDLDLSALGLPAGAASASLRTLTGRLHDDSPRDFRASTHHFTSQVTVTEGLAQIALPERSVSVLVVPLVPALSQAAR